MQSMQMNQAVMEGLKGSTVIMSKINEDMNVSDIKDVLKEFQKEMMKADMNGEMMQDAMEMAEDPNAAADAEGVYESILGEIGLEYESGQAAVSKTKLEAPKEEVAEKEDDLEARLAALRM